ncbi:MAG: hypothetical protein ICV78_02185 [Tolypothrix sp. Co-bin9]|nr:hypothetical protein [Tolypothrix sp. Co-bin9]
MSQKISFKNSNNPNITMSALINFPEGFDESKKYPAIAANLCFAALCVDTI